VNGNLIGEIIRSGRPDKGMPALPLTSAQIADIAAYLTLARVRPWLQGNSTIRALDYRTGKVVWNHEIGDGDGGAGIMTTAGHLLSTGDTQGNLLALNPSTGETLWHLSAGAQMLNCPMTYELDGRQYVLMAADDTLYAFALPTPKGQ